MSRRSRCVLLTAALSIGALAVTTVPARAEETAGLLEQATALANQGGANASFLTAGMVQVARTSPPPAAAPQQTRGQNQSGFGFGIKGGFLFSSLSSAQDNFSSKGGTAIGIFFGGNRTGAVGVMGELLLANKSFGEEGSDSEDNLKVNFIEIPILLRINIGESNVNGLNFYGIAGPVFDIRLKAKQNNFDVKSNYEALDLGFIAGGGVEFLRFIAELRYNWGLRNIQNGNLATFADLHTRTFMVLFGFRIN